MRLDDDLARWIVLVAILLVTASAALDITVVNVAISNIREDLGGNLASSQWIISIYAATYATFIVPAGRLVDLHGARRIWMIGVCFYGAMSLLCGFALTEWWLIGARALQGVAAATMAPAGFALVAKAFAERHRGFALGVLAAGLGIFSAFGPLVGGALTSWLDWRWIFFMNIPLVTAGLLLMLVATVRVRTETRRADLDVVGTITFTVFVLGVLYATIESRSQSLLPELLGASLLAVAAGVCFWLYERRRAEPMVDFSMFRSRVISAAALAKFVSSAAFFGMFFYLVIFLEGVEELSAFETGVRVFPSAVGAAGTALLAGKLIDRWGPRWLLFVGLLFGGVSIVWLSFAGLGDYWTVIFPALVLNGIGYGFVSAPAQTAAINAVDEHRVGRVSSLLSIAGKLGAAFGVALSAALFHALSRGDVEDAARKLGLAITDAEIDVAAALIGSTAPHMGMGKFASLTVVEVNRLVDAAFVFTFSSTMRSIGVAALVAAFVVVLLIGRNSMNRTGKA